MLGGGSETTKAGTVLNSGLVYINGKVDIGDFVSVNAIRGRGELNVDNLLSRSVVKYDVSYYRVSSSQLTHATLVGEEEGLKINAKNTPHFAGTKISGKNEINSKDGVAVHAVPKIEANHAFAYGKKWSWDSRTISMKHIVPEVGGELTINADGTLILQSTDGSDASALITKSTHKDVLLVAAKDLDFKSVEAFSKKKKLLKTKRSYDHKLNHIETALIPKFGTYTDPMLTFHSESGGNFILEGGEIHTLSYKVKPGGKLLLLPVEELHINQHTSQVSNAGVLGFKNFKVIMYKEKGSFEDSSNVRLILPQIFYHGNDTAVLIGGGDVNITSSILYSKNGDFLTQSINGNVFVDAKNNVHASINKKYEKTLSQGPKFSWDELAYETNWQQYKISEYEARHSPVPTQITAKNITIITSGNNTFYDYGGQYKFKDLTIIGSVESNVLLAHTAKALKNQNTEFAFKFGFFNEVAKATHKTQHAIESDGNAITKISQVQDAMISWFKAFYCPITMDLKFTAKYNQGKFEYDNLEVVPSTFEGENTYIKGAKVKLVGSVINGVNFRVDAKEFILRNAFNSFEYKEKSKGGDMEITFLNPSLFAGVNFHKLKESGITPTNLIIKLSGNCEVNSEIMDAEGIKFEAKNVILNLNKLFLKSAERELKRQGRGGSIGASGGMNLDNFKDIIGNIGAEVEYRDTKWIDEMSSIVGFETVQIIANGVVEIMAGKIANIKFDENGNPLDGGNVTIKTAELIVQNFLSYDKGNVFGYGYSGGIPGVGSQKQGMFGASQDFTFGLTDREKLTRATIGNGKIDAQSIRGIVNRDINNAETAKGFEIKRTTYSHREVDWESAAKMVQETFAQPVKVVERVTNRIHDGFDRLSEMFGTQEEVPEPSIWEIIDIKPDPEDVEVINLDESAEKKENNKATCPVDEPEVNSFESVIQKDSSFSHTKEKLYPEGSAKLSDFDKSYKADIPDLEIPSQSPQPGDSSRNSARKVVHFLGKIIQGVENFAKDIIYETSDNSAIVADFAWNELKTNNPNLAQDLEQMGYKAADFVIDVPKYVNSGLDSYMDNFVEKLPVSSNILLKSGEYISKSIDYISEGVSNAAKFAVDKTPESVKETVTGWKEYAKNNIDDYVRTSTPEELKVYKSLGLAGAAAVDYFGSGKITKIFRLEKIEVPKGFDLDYKTYTGSELNKMPGQKKGLVFMLESPRGNKDAIDFHAGTIGAKIDPDTDKFIVPALRYDNPDGFDFIKFDGLEVGPKRKVLLIDAKRNLPFWTKTGMDNIGKTLDRIENAILQNPGYKVAYEFPNKQVADKFANFVKTSGKKNVVGIRIRGE